MMAIRAFLAVCLLLMPAGIGWATGSELGTEPAEETAPAEAVPPESIAQPQPAQPAEASEGASLADVAAGSSTEEAEVAPAGNVLRAILTTGISDREPVDSVEALSNDVQQIFFFTEIENASGQTLTHRWQHAGSVVAEVPLTIGADRWRTYSSKLLDPGWLGDWTVSVVDEAGRILSSASFSYSTVPADAAEPETPAEEIAPASPSME